MREILRKAVTRIAYTNPQQQGRLSALEKSLVPLLAAASVVYQVGLSVRHQLYKWNVFSSVRLPVPVISVGNITWGGNGKTPMVEYLAHCFLRAGICPLILTRGYGGGDEVRLLQSHLCQTTALIGIGHKRDEVAATFLQKHGVMNFQGIFRLAYRNNGCRENNRVQLLMDCITSDTPGKGDKSKNRSSTKEESIGVILMDDGMQHWRIIRDIEIVMVNAVSLFGNGSVVPYGPLREPMDALNRANIIFIHHANLVSWETVQAIRLMLKPLLNPETLIFSSKMVPHFLIRLPNVLLEYKDIFSDCLEKRPELMEPVEILKGSTVLCVSGIGCPESFSLSLEQLGVACVERFDFPDHHFFQEEDLLIVQRRFHDLRNKSKQSFIVVTEKVVKVLASITSI